MVWIIFIVALTGAVLNVKSIRWCFPLWMVSNGSWLIINLRGSDWPQAACYGIFFIVSIYGWFAWGKKGRLQSGESMAKATTKEIIKGLTDENRLQFTGPGGTFSYLICHRLFDDCDGCTKMKKIKLKIGNTEIESDVCTKYGPL